MMRIKEIVKKPRRIISILALILLFILPLLTDSAYSISMMIMAGVYAMLAIGFGLLLGQAGQISLGVGAFFGIGAYTSAILTLKLQVPSVLSLIAGAALAGLVAFIVGRPILKLKSYFLALATLGLASIFIVFVQQTTWLTGGSMGMNGIPWLSIGGFEFDTYFKQYYLVWVIAIIMLLLSKNSLGSRVGRALRSLAVSEVAASSLGVNVADWKVRTFVVSSVYSGLAGGLYAFVMSSINYQNFGLTVSMTVLIMIIAGGIESLTGSVVGALLITYLGNVLSGFEKYSTGLYALVLILLLIFIPGGLAAMVNPKSYAAMKSRLQRLRSKKAAGDSRSERAAALAESMPEKSTAAADHHVSIENWRRSPANKKSKDSGEPLLKLEDISVFFGGVKAVNGVSLTVREGQITALIGPNGAGKTTLFNVISGLQKPTKGKVWFEDQDITKLKDYKVARLAIARTFQNLRIFSNMTVLENVMTGRHQHEKAGFISAAVGLQKREEKNSRERSMEALALVGLDHLADWEVTALPYGQQRLVEIARALATEPTLLLLDEPAAGMNATERIQLVEKINRIAEAGVNILLVEHDIDLVMGLSDNVSVLDFGKLIACGTPQEVQENPAVIEAYIGVKEKGRWEALGEEDTRTPRQEQEKPLLKVEGVSTYYGSIGAVRDVSMEVYPGEILAVLGSNGAGKTTLLRTISGLLKSREGRILFHDTDITRLAPQKIAALGISHVPEGRLIFPTLSVQDNLRLGACRRGDKNEINKDFEFIYELFPILAERRKQIAGTLSGGQQQMLAIGRALMGRPQLLILDEPSMGLAPQVVEQIFETLVRLNREQGITLLIVEQNAEIVLSFAHHAIVLQTGSIALSGVAKDLAKDERVRDLYLGRKKGA